MIRANALTKRYGDTTVVQDPDFTVRPGSAAPLPDPALLAPAPRASVTLVASTALLRRRDACPVRSTRPEGDE
ncbi:hypothetical protein OG242_17060 [Streptomyces sp. NBC_00727]|uniref:hypothetical protein n=1 Tax=Streptomyces sp. NBC_00727 TaxID=2903675 RepID=UPI0038678692